MRDERGAAVSPGVSFSLRGRLHELAHGGGDASPGNCKAMGEYPSGYWEGP